MSERPQAFSDGNTVWVNNDYSGSNLGRFSKFGLDIFRKDTEQMAGRSHCLACKMGPTTIEDWRAFQAAMAKHYKVNISDRHMPMFLRERR